MMKIRKKDIDAFKYLILKATNYIIFNFLNKYS